MLTHLHYFWNGYHQVGFMLTLNQNNIDLVHQHKNGGMGAFACWSYGLKGRLSMLKVTSHIWLKFKMCVCDKISVCEDLDCEQVVIGSRRSSW